MHTVNDKNDILLDKILSVVGKKSVIHNQF